METRRLSAKTAVVAGTVVSLAAVLWFQQQGTDTSDALFILCPGLAFTLMLLFASGGVMERVQLWVERSPSRIAYAPALLWLLFSLYAAGTSGVSLTSEAVMAAYLGVPFLLLRPSLKPPLRNWLEAAAILWLWLPLELGWIRGQLPGPGRNGQYAFTQLLAFDSGILAFAVWRRMPGIGYRLEWSRRIAKTALIWFAGFAAIAIPLGFAIRFIRVQFEPDKLWFAPLTFCGVFLFTALPEEFLFRGVIQNWLQRVAKSRAGSLAIAAVVFGASHLNNGPPVPNYRYFLMATIAGVFYGQAWRRGGSLMPAALTHALVDTCWTVFFR